MSSLFASLLTSAGVGAGAGLNAYATMLVFGLLARLQPAQFQGDLAQFFASKPVLACVAILYGVEFIADKVPAVDHVWDVVHTFIRPAAAALVAWASVSKGMPQGAVIVAAALAGTTALGTHAAKATTRVASTLTTGGLGNPVLSLIEDLLAFAGVLTALLAPLLVIVVLLLLGAFFLVVLRRRRRPAAV